MAYGSGEIKVHGRVEAGVATGTGSRELTQSRENKLETGRFHILISKDASQPSRLNLPK